MIMMSEAQVRRPTELNEAVSSMKSQHWQNMITEVFDNVLVPPSERQ